MLWLGWSINLRSHYYSSDMCKVQKTLVFLCSLLCWHLCLCILYTFGESAVLALMLQRSMVINMMGRAARLQTTDSRIFSNNTGIIAWMDTFILHERISLTVRIESNVTNIACWNCQSLIRKEIMWTEKSSVEQILRYQCLKKSLELNPD